MRYIILSIFATLITVGIILLTNLKFDYNIQSYFDPTDPEVNFYNEHVERFENDNNFLLIGINNHQNVFEKNFMKKIDSLSDELSTLEYVISVTSPTSIREKNLTPFGLITRPLINYNSTKKLEGIKEQIITKKEYYKSLFSTNYHSVLLVLKIKKPKDFQEGQSILNQIKKIVGTSELKDVNYAGRLNTRAYYVSKIGSQTINFTIISITLLIGFLAFSFRTVLGVLLPIFILAVSVILSLAVVQVSLGKLDLMLSMLPSIVFVVGVSYAVHFMSKYAEVYHIKKDKLEALKYSVKNIWSTIAITVLTTALGFLSLYLIPIKPIQDFALYNSIAIVLTGIVSIVLLPIILSFIKPELIFKKSALVSKPGKSQAKLISSVLRKPNQIIIGTSIAIVIFLIGASHIKTNSNFLDDLSKTSDLGKELSYFESNFGGIRPFEMSIETSRTSEDLFTFQHLKEIEEVEAYLENEYEVSGMISPLTILMAANKSFNGGSSKRYILPKSTDELSELMNKIKIHKVFDKYQNIVTQDLKTGRIYGRIPDYGSSRYSEKNKKLYDFLTEKGYNVKFHLTGAAELMDTTNAHLANKLLLGIGFGIIVVTLIIWLVFRSLTIALVSILPNVIPVLVIACFMGIIGVDLKVSTSLAFTIIFGISVDDTVHILRRIKSELSKRDDMRDAILQTYRYTGKAVILTSFVVSAGFMAFMISEFTGLFYFGFLIAIGILAALLADYLILPTLLSKINTKYFLKS